MGELMSVGAALVWSISVILFKQTAPFSPVGMNLFKNVVAIFCLFLTLMFMGIPVDWDRSMEDWVLLTISGVLGIGVADTLFFAGLRRLGAGLLAVVECAYTPFVVLMSVLWLGEQLSLSFFIGAVSVFVGLLLATMDPNLRDGDISPSDFRWGTFYGVLSMATMAVGIVIVKPVLERSDLIEVTQARLVIGALSLLIWIAISGRWRDHFAVFGRGKHWATLTPAALLGSYLAMIFWVGGMKYTAAAVAGVLSQTATVFTLILSWWILKEKMTVRKGAGAAAAMIGALVIGWASHTG